MKTKTLKLTGIISLCLLMVLTLTGCKVTEKNAEKIQKAADNKEPYTIAEVEKMLGEPVLKLDVVGNGGAIWVKGYKEADSEKLQKDIEDGKTLKGIVTVYLGGKCVAASYEEIDAEEINKLLK